MSADDVTRGTELRLERVLPASVEDVFAAWTTSSVMARWLSPTGRADVEADVRVGGHLRVTMIGDDQRIEHTGEFRELDPPRLLSFTWRSAYTGDVPSLVTVRLSPHPDGGTHLVLVHEQLPDDAAASHAGGWTAILDRLLDVLQMPSPDVT